MAFGSERGRKILYVCPFAHRAGHAPMAVCRETRALVGAGFELTLLTFDGLRGEGEVPARHVTVLSRGKASGLIRSIDVCFDRSMRTRNVSALIEMFLSLTKAVSLRNNEGYQTIYLRDGNPFPFLPLLLGSLFKGCDWVVHMTNDPSVGLLAGINYAKLWKPIYRRSLARNRYVILCLTEPLKRQYEMIMNGLFVGMVVYLPPLIEHEERLFPKEEARKRLDLPEGKTLFLSFGAFHSGKDTRLVIRALRDFPDTLLVLAGKFTESEMDIVRATEKHAIIRNYYVPEEEKPLYFAAAEGVVLAYTKGFLKSICPSMLWEACRFRRPVIASDAGQLGEFVRLFQLGVLFEPENESSLKKAIRSFLSLTGEEVNAIRNNCGRFSAEYSLERWAETYVKECVSKAGAQ